MITRFAATRATALACLIGLLAATDAGAQGSATPGSPVKSGYDFNAVLTPAGEVWTWGGNYRGTLGNGTTASSAVPVRVAGLSNVLAIAAGEGHVLAVRQDGTVWSWGDNSSGQLGIGSASPSLCGTVPCAVTPQQIAGLSGVVAVAAGGAHSIAVDANGSIWTWGGNAAGQLGRTPGATPSDRPGTVPGVPGPARDVAAGTAFSLGLMSNGTLMAWGANDRGQLGNGTTANASTAAVVPGMSQVEAIAAGSAHALALRGDRSVWAWGWNRFGQVGDGNRATSRPDVMTLVPAQVLANAVEIVAGYTFSLARVLDGTVMSWGVNHAGQLARTTTTNCHTGHATSLVTRCSALPTATEAALAGSSAIAAGGAHLLAVAASGAITAIGINTAGQAGQPDAWTRFRPPEQLYAPVGFCAPVESQYECLITLQPDSGTTGGVGLRSSSGSVNIANLSGLAFEAQLRNTTSAKSTLTLENDTGTGLRDSTGVTFSVTGISVSGDFTLSSDCGVLATRATCSVDVYFSPLAVGRRAGTLIVYTSLSGSETLSMDLAGTGVSAPESPGDVVATAGAGQAIVGFSPPASDGGSPVLDFTATSSPAGLSATGSSSPIVVPGLASGIAYTFTVVARNQFGTGPPSAPSNAITLVAPALLDVSRTGSGTVTSDPAGIDCGAACSVNFAAGSQVTLTATPASGSQFLGWGGACTGTGSCVVTVDAVTSVTAAFTAPTLAAQPRLGNISTRGLVFTGDDVMIGGFVIGGASPKTVLVRARGPSMIAAGVTNAMANPQLTLVSGSTIVATNDDFGTAPNLAEIQATGKAPTNALESAILVTLQPGAYTAVVSGVGGGTGVGIVEVFEVDRPDIPLVNISTRGQVQAGDNVMIGGFIIDGDTPKTVLVRARGPSMIPAGVLNALANPQLTLVSGSTVIATNDDFGTSLNLVAIQATGQAPTNALESAILITLNPGAYTAVVSGVGGGTGVGIVEVFAQ